jgi:hypothetical protein
MTIYNLVIDFERDEAIVDLKTNDLDSGILAPFVQAFRQITKDHIKDGYECQVATYILSNTEATEYQALIPCVADFSFVQSKDTPSKSNLLVLM